MHAIRFFILSVLFIVLWANPARPGPLERLLYPDKARLIIVFPDVTRSVFEDDRVIYRRNYEDLLSRLRAGDRVVVAPISDRTLTSFAPVIDREIPGAASGLAKEAILKRAGHELEGAFDFLLKRAPKVNESRILDALNVGEQLIEGDRNRKVRWMIFLSDMLEDSDEARFEQENLSPARIKQIIERRKAHGTFPRLEGVRVFVAGARAKTTTKFFEVQTFWQEYTKAAEAMLKRGDYVRDGLRFGN
jgi:hypothetical protein